MKKYITLLLFFIIGNTAFAQKEPILSYEWFEEKSKTISELQMKKTGLKSDEFDVTFPKDNTKIYYSDKLASCSFNLKKDGQEFVALTEDIDFSKAKGIFEDNNIVYVVFPENSLTMQVYGNGRVNTAKADAIGFHTNSDADRDKMFSTLYEIISFLKIEKGLIRNNGDWEKHWQEFHKMNPYEFYQKYPQSVLAYEGKLLEEDYNRQAEFLQSFLKKYNKGVKWGLTIEDALPLDESIKKLYKIKKRKIDKAYLDYKSYFKNATPYASYFNAITEYYFGELSRIKDIDYTILITKDEEEAKQKVEELKKELLNNLDERFQDKKPETDNYGNYKFLHEVDLTKTTLLGKKLPEHSTYEYHRIQLNINPFNYKNEKWYSVVLKLQSDEKPYVERYDWINY